MVGIKSPADGRGIIDVGFGLADRDMPRMAGSWKWNFAPDDGFDVIVNRINRSFGDREMAAYGAARHLKECHRGDFAETHVLATGQRVVILADGRTG